MKYVIKYIVYDEKGKIVINESNGQLTGTRTFSTHASNMQEAMAIMMINEQLRGAKIEPTNIHVIPS